MGVPARHCLKVRHYEADAYEHVNHANYVHYLEVGRLEALESLGISLQEMRRQGYLIVARDLSVRFHAPARPGETPQPGNPVERAADIAPEEVFDVFGSVGNAKLAGVKRSIPEVLVESPVEIVGA